MKVVFDSTKVEILTVPYDIGLKLALLEVLLKCPFHRVSFFRCFYVLVSNFKRRYLSAS